MKIEHLPSSPRYIPKFQKPAGFEEFIGVSRKMATLLNKADIATRFPTAVLITGESGTGRKLLAQAIAQKSVSDGFPVKIVTFTDKASFMEPVLLGDGIRPGKLKEADNGVIILDNINKCSLYTQMTLLNIMRDTQSNCYTSRPTAPNQPEISSKFRIIATSSENLLELVREGQFSEELYYLLADITIQTPPLKGRGDDILLLAHYFLQCANKELQTDSSPRINKSLSTNAQKALKKYSWPGNLRELKHKIRQAWIFAEGNEIESVDLFPNSHHKTLPEKIPSGFNLKKKIDDQQKEYIKLAMKQTDEKKAEAAKLLGLKSYQALDVKIKSLKISPWYQEEDNADSKQANKISTNKKVSKDQQSKSQ
jgi:two-component system response regulator HydG